MRFTSERAALAFAAAHKMTVTEWVSTSGGKVRLNVIAHRDFAVYGPNKEMTVIGSGPKTFTIVPPPAPPADGEVGDE